MSLPDTPAADASTLRVDVVRGTPTDEELAALIAVVTEVYSQEEASATAADRSDRSAWQISARSLRSPLRRDLGWGRFGG
ncbi:acyl-CoA carboxylase subunit epsilon [Microbacterium elymi]|uniref:Acyl-CoA carboxylase subunit epsilon n=1 Tax=Microbacterium elymi TaxID=2909587 RepID=A0ABY5NKR9_9MICO|nr:acyl-CoA carboxylase subunit epsilon [Microbacterium elymi]UUT35760.1 acyl-CoA carboxylase subunit epsilon [Microbacterium elymi]